MTAGVKIDWTNRICELSSVLTFTKISTPREKKANGSLTPGRLKKKNIWAYTALCDFKSKNLETYLSYFDSICERKYMDLSALLKWHVVKERILLLVILKPRYSLCTSWLSFSTLIQKPDDKCSINFRSLMFTVVSLVTMHSLQNILGDTKLVTVTSLIKSF